MSGAIELMKASGDISGGLRNGRAGMTMTSKQPSDSDLRWSLVLFGQEGARKILRDYLLFAIIWTPAIVALWTFVFDPVDEFIKSLLISLVIAETAMAACYFGAHLISAVERTYYLRKGLSLPKRSVFYHVLKGCLFMWPGMYAGFELVALLAPIYGFDWRTPDFGNYKRGLVIGLFNAALFLALYLKYEADQLKKKAESEKKEFESRTLKAQIAALTAQMNPHLLFNSLNSIASMIHSEPNKAEDMTVELSSLYRRVLDASKKERHSLSDELDLCRSYLEIEKSRFQDRIKYNIEIEAGVDPVGINIPVLCLQPFVENAVKHGLLPKSEGGCISIRVAKRSDQILIAVEDDGIGVNHAKTTSKGSGTALSNCESRLKLAYGNLARLLIQGIEPHGTRVMVEFPSAGGNV